MKFKRFAQDILLLIVMETKNLIFINALLLQQKGGNQSQFQNWLVLPAVTKFKSQQPIRIKCQAVNQGPSTYSSQISTDVPFYETPGLHLISI
ncbi:Integrin alpha-9 [Bienertia sinuspersici]